MEDSIDSCGEWMLQNTYKSVLSLDADTLAGKSAEQDVSRLNFLPSRFR